MNEFFGIDLATLIESTGYLGLFGIIFAESGLFVGFFLPGDSLLFTAGLLASQGYLNIFMLLTVCFLGAVLGDSFGYMFGKKIGPALFTKERSLFFHREYIERAIIFYEKHGAKTIVLARFLPIVRTFAPILAGVGKMHYPTFLFYNFMGAGLWAIGLTLLGYHLGNIVPNIERYLIPIVLVIIVISILPPLFHIIKHKEIFGRK
ncbi:MAG: DedA family protein [bacterium]|nr:DedA family protein [bacterium]